MQVCQDRRTQEQNGTAMYYRRFRRDRRLPAVNDGSKIASTCLEFEWVILLYSEPSQSVNSKSQRSSTDPDRLLLKAHRSTVKVVKTWHFLEVKIARAQRRLRRKGDSMLIRKLLHDNFDKIQK